MGMFDWLFPWTWAERAGEAGRTTATQITTPRGYPPGTLGYQIASMQALQQPTTQPTPRPPTRPPEVSVLPTLGIDWERRGYELGRGIPISPLSREAYKRLSWIAQTIRRGEPEVTRRLIEHPFLGPYVGPATAFVTERGIRSIAGLIETAGMVPGGLEVLAKRPEIIPASVVVGSMWTAQGIAAQLREDPAQLAMDLWITKKAFDLAGKVPVGKIVPSELRPLPKSIAEMPKGLLPAKQVKYESAIEVAERLQRTPPEIKRPLDFTKVKTLSDNVRAARESETYLRSISKHEDLVIGGSGAAWTQVKGARLPGDLDLNVRNPSKVSQSLTEILQRNYGRQNVKVEHLMEFDQYTISRKVGREWHHVFDVKKVEPIGAIVERVGLPVQEPISIGGMRYKTFGELVARKIDSAVHPQPGGIISPQPHRIVKDLADLETYTRTAWEVKEAQIARSIPVLKELRQYRLTKAQEAYESYRFHTAFGIEAYPEAIRMYGRLPYPVRRVPQMLVAAGLRPSEYREAIRQYPKPRPSLAPSKFLDALEKYPVPTRVPPYEPPYPPPKKPPYELPKPKEKPIYPIVYPEKYPERYPEKYPEKYPETYPYPYKYPEKYPRKYPERYPETMFQKVTIREKPNLPLKKFEEQLRKYKQNKKRSGLYVWDIRNPVPTLEDLLEEIG